MKKFYEKYLHNYGVLCVFTSLIINFAIECFSRRSLIDGINYLVSSPLVFLYNSLIILITLSVILLVKRRIFVYSLISIVWLAFGIANGVVLSKRVTPFTAIELKLLDSVVSIMDKYLSDFQIGLIIFGIITLVLGLIAAFIFAPKYKNKINYKKNSVLFILSILLFIGVTKIAIKTNVVNTYFGNIAYAYLDYGFPYCFSNTLVNTGIDEPENYSEEAVKSIFADVSYSSSENMHLLVSKEDESVQADVSTATLKTPNIIFLQLESFFDPSYVMNLKMSENPIPNFQKLRREYSSGFLSVPSVGAGTANTEFEVMTGMNLEFFGPGEYPYKTILKKKTVESVGYDLKNLGYSTHAIHNNKGTFYTRQNVFKNLGYDTFTSVEYMNIKEFTPLEWAKDKYLTSEILDALNSTEEQDYIYTISVQGHGDYPEYEVPDHSKITVSGIEDEGLKNAFEYYVNEISEMDDFIGQLVETLSNYDEDVVLVMYGDHLPSLDINDKELYNQDTYQTEYIVWSNFEMEKQNKNLEAYQLNSQVLGMLGINEGTLTKYHQLYQDKDNYQENLKLLQYDMLYGEQFIYDGINPFEPVNMKMGVKDITISNVYEFEGNIYVKGNNFTDSSKITINGSESDTIFIDNNTLMIEEETLDDEDVIRVNQVTVTDFTLSKSDSYVYTKPLEGIE